MVDFEFFAKLQIQRDLQLAESMGDEEWAAGLREQAKEYEPESPPEPEPEPRDELEDLRAQAEVAGIKVDGRWGVDRLREELARHAEENG